MKRALLMLAVTAMLATPSMAGLYQTYEVTGDVRAPINTNYDNWTNPPSALLGIYKTGGVEIDDDLSMVNVGYGLLDTMGLNVANADAPSNLTGGTGTIWFYGTGADPSVAPYLGAVGFTLPALNLAAGQSSRIQFGAGALIPANIILPASCWVGWQFDTVTFAGTGSIANVGIQIRGPIGVGASGDQLYDYNAATMFNFSGNPLANTGLYIKTDFTPEPSTLVLLSLGVVALIRRR